MHEIFGKFPTAEFGGRLVMMSDLSAGTDYSTLDRFIGRTASINRVLARIGPFLVWPPFL